MQEVHKEQSQKGRALSFLGLLNTSPSHRAANIDCTPAICNDTTLLNVFAEINSFPSTTLLRCYYIPFTSKETEAQKYEEMACITLKWKSWYSNPRYLTPGLICHIAFNTATSLVWPEAQSTKLILWTCLPKASMVPPLPSRSSLNSRSFKILSRLASCHSPPHIHSYSCFGPPCSVCRLFLPSITRNSPLPA